MHNPSGGHRISSKSIFQPAAINLRFPVLTLVVAAIAVPIEWRPLGHATPSFGMDPVLHIAENVAGFVPVGLVLGELGFLRACVLGSLISLVSEAGQLFMAYRDPSMSDFLANTAGTVVGAFISTHWSLLRTPALKPGKWKAAIAAAMAVAIIYEVGASSGDPLNFRGVTSPGVLEADWKFDERSGDTAIDSSGHQLDGRFRGQPRRIAGLRGGAAALDGIKDYIDVGHSSGLRITGSMTISAWINSTSFPKDDAAIVSQFQHGSGYQLDTTVDKGLRGIGFKLTDGCGDLMARYGATPLVTGTWYHLAGVYDAEARTLDVYLNGRLDNGFLLGRVTGKQHSSHAGVYIGRRRDLEGFGFIGSIDEIRIYSFALSSQEVGADMRGEVIQRAAERDNARKQQDADCTISSDYEDSNIPLEAALLGVLAAIACAGFRPPGLTIACLASSLAAGLMLIPVMAPTVPSLSRWMMPLVSLAGGVSVAVSLRPR